MAPSSSLHNQLDLPTAQNRLANEPFKRRTVSFYKYVILENVADLRDQLFEEWNELGVLGRVYIAQEGINAQISVPEPHWEKFRELLYKHAPFTSVPFKEAIEADVTSFLKLTIKVKKQIVADGLTMADYDITNVGTHLGPEEFNSLMEKPDTVVVDMRNQYESEIGHFETALCPDADTFREELPQVKKLLNGQEDKKVLLYCTGGIRCEKASAYLKHHGFKNVYQLHGGIINYAHVVKNKGLPSKFKGKNFVFDGRRAERITDDILSACHICGTACDTHVNCRNENCNLLFIQCPSCGEKFQGCCAEKCLTISKLPVEERRILRQKEGERPFARYRRFLRPKEVLV